MCIFCPFYNQIKNIFFQNINSGTCHCDENFGSGDCSQDLRIPPDVTAINPENSGLCEEGDCVEVNVNGDLFLDETGLTCQFTRFQVCSS